jgi:hypothetical protein
LSNRAVGPPESEGPGAAVTATGAQGIPNRKRKSSRVPKPTQSERRALFTLTLGRETIGKIEQDGAEFTAIAGDCRLGVFPNLKASTNALSDGARAA